MDLDFLYQQIQSYKDEFKVIIKVYVDKINILENINNDLKIANEKLVIANEQEIKNSEVLDEELNEEYQEIERIFSDFIEQKIKQQYDELSDLKEQIVMYKIELSDLKDQNCNYEQVITELTKKDDNLNILQKELTKKDDNLNILQKELNKKDDNLNILQKELNKKDDEIHYLKEQLNNPVKKYKLIDWIPKDKIDIQILSKNYSIFDLLYKNESYDFLMNTSLLTTLSHIQKYSKEYRPGFCTCSGGNMCNFHRSIKQYGDKLMHSPYIVIPVKDHQFEKFFNKSFNDNILNCLKNEGEYKILNNISYPYDTDIWNVPSKENIDDIISDIKSYGYDQNKINELWNKLSLHQNKKAIDILKNEYLKHDSKINMKYLSINPLAIDILEIEYNKPNCTIDWKNLSANPKAINILKKEYVKPNCRISWKELSSNPCAMEILKTEYFKTNCKIIWERFWLNPSIVEIR